MNASTFEVERPKTSIKRLLKEQVPKAAKGYDEALSQPIEAWDEANYKEVLKFVLLCDALAQLKSHEVVGADRELQWAAIAGNECKNALGGYAKTKLFTDPHYLASEELQRVFYQDMRDRRIDVVGGARDGELSGWDYANEVARGMIILSEPRELQEAPVN